MTREEYRRMLELKFLLHSTYGLTEHKTIADDFYKLYQEYMVLRKKYYESKK